MDNQKSTKGIIAAIVVAFLIVFALLAAILYFVATGSAQKPDTAENGPVQENTESGTQDSSDSPNASDETAADADEEMIRQMEAAQAAEAAKTKADGPDRVIDLAPYTSKCPDVYAWIEIPGTDIDYPVVYCEDAVDPFYFTHDIDGAPSEKGMIITDSLNGKDFSDPLTLIYGQAPDDGTMFAELHNFRDAGFFDRHDTINIYIGDTELVYRIYACYIGSSDHILVNNDFSDPIGFMSFFDSIEEIRDLSINIRKSAKPVLGDHVIALVTHCADESKRLFVHATLVQTKE